MARELQALRPRRPARRGHRGTDLRADHRAAIDCRAFGYTDLAQAVIYLTSHDVEGFRNERLFNFLQANGVVDTEKRIKLAFVCLLTAVGIPQILAGDEFADQHDLFDQNGNVSQDGGKQVDPVNYTRLDDDWRTRIKDHVARLVKFRTHSAALAVNDVEFIHVDLNDKQVVAWRRGNPRHRAGRRGRRELLRLRHPARRLGGVRRAQLAGHPARHRLAGGLAGPGRAPGVGRTGTDLSLGGKGLHAGLAAVGMHCR